MRNQIEKAKQSVKHWEEAEARAFERCSEIEELLYELKTKPSLLSDDHVKTLIEMTDETRRDRFRHLRNMNESLKSAQRNLEIAQGKRKY